MSYRLNAPVTLGQIETNDTYLWEKMKQYITDHAIDIDTRDRILARLNTIIGGDKNFTVLSQQCDYLDTFKDSLYNLFVEQGATAIINYDIMQWVSAMRMKLGLFGCYIYAIDADDIEHFYTDTEWAAMRIEAAETGKELPKCFGSVINNSSYTIVIGYTKPNQTRQWGTYGRSCGASGNPTLLLRIYDPLQALYLYNDQLVQIVSSVEEIEERAETAPSGTRFVLMASVGEKVLAVGDYAMNGDKYEFIDSTSHPWIGLTKEAFTATEYLGAVQQFTVPYKDTQGIYGVPAELFCAQYHAFEGDDLVWRLPNQGELALLNVNYNMVNAQKSTVTDAMLPTGYVWSSQEYVTNSANCTTLPGGSASFNGKTSWYSVVPVAAFKWRHA